MGQPLMQMPPASADRVDAAADALAC